LWFCVKWLGGANIENSTFSNNIAATGGGIAIVGVFMGGNPTIITVTLRNVTITQNRGDNGGGLHIANGGVLSTDDILVTLYNTIIDRNRNVAGNQPSNIDPAGRDVNTSSSNNLLGPNGTGGLTATQGNIIDVGNDPMLGPLHDNGGPTLTHRPLGPSHSGSNITN